VLSSVWLQYRQHSQETIRQHLNYRERILLNTVDNTRQNKYTKPKLRTNIQTQSTTVARHAMNDKHRRHCPSFGHLPVICFTVCGLHCCSVLYGTGGSCTTCLMHEMTQKKLTGRGDASKVLVSGLLVRRLIFRNFTVATYCCCCCCCCFCRLAVKALQVSCKQLWLGSQRLLALRRTIFLCFRSRHSWIRTGNTVLRYDTIQRLHSKTDRTCQFRLAHKN